MSTVLGVGDANGELSSSLVGFASLNFLTFLLKLSNKDGFSFLQKLLGTKPVWFLEFKTFHLKKY